MRLSPVSRETLITLNFARKLPPASPSDGRTTSSSCAAESAESLIGFRRGAQQTDHERCAASWLAFAVDRATVGFEYLLAHRQAQPGSVLLGGKEGFEDAGLSGCLDS